jgi:hypothetical protein
MNAHHLGFLRAHNEGQQLALSLGKDDRLVNLVVTDCQTRRRPI